MLRYLAMIQCRWPNHLRKAFLTELLNMRIEQKKFNESFKSAIANLGMSVEEWVAKKMHYKSVEELCYDGDKVDDSNRRIIRFSQEQIDAIGTAIWNHHI